MRRTAATALIALMWGVPAGFIATPALPADAGKTAQTPPQTQPQTPSQTQEDRYRTCMSLISSDPQAAFEVAQAWRKKGGGDPAGHCEAAAAFALGRFIDAAQDLEALARGPRNPTAAERDEEDSQRRRLLRASLWAQAAHAWLSADRPEEAERAATEASKLQPRDPSPLILHARALAAQHRWSDAVADLDRAIALNPKLTEAYVFRASALREMRVYDRAAADLDAALALDPQQPEALLERGILLRLQGDDTGARAAWTALISSSPKTPAAEEARLNLEKMDKGG